MGLVKTMGRFCYVECDDQNCNKKIEKNDEDALKKLAEVCDWESRGDRWLCPECVKKEPVKKKTSSRSN